MKPPSPWRSSPGPAAWGALLFLLCLALYLHTLCPAFMDDDSAETVAAGVTLGLQHPPSYALDTLFVRLASFLPLGGMALRINVFSAFLASLAAVLLAWNILLALEGFPGAPSRRTSLLCAGTGALLLAFSGTYWEKALGAKGGIYLLQILLLQTFFHSFLRHERENPAAPWRTFRWFYLAGFLFALGLTNHWETQVVFLPLLPLFLLKTGARRLSGALSAPAWKSAFRLGAFMVLGLSALLFLPLRAHLHPDWNLGDPETFHFFAKSLLRGYVEAREPGFLGLLASFLDGRASGHDFLHLARLILNRQGAALGSHLVKDMTWPGLGLAVLGLAAPWGARGRKILLFELLSLLLLFLVFFTSLWVPKGFDSGWLMDNYLLPANAVASFLAAVGLCELVRRLPRPAATALVPAVLALLFLPAAARFPRLNLSRQALRYDYGVNLLKSAPKGCVLFAEADEDYFPLLYLQRLEGLRRDVRMIPTFTLFEPWGLRQVERLHPGLGLTEPAGPFPDHFARIFYACSEIVDKSRGQRPVAFTYFDGAFHRDYLARRRPSPLFRKSGMVLLLNDPSLGPQPCLPLSALRTRDFTGDPSDFHPVLRGIRAAYRAAGVLP